jgi:hypothetical protein
LYTDQQQAQREAGRYQLFCLSYFVQERGRNIVAHHIPLHGLGRYSKAQASNADLASAGHATALNSFFFSQYTLEAFISIDGLS